MKARDRMLLLLGMCKRAGCLRSGAVSVEQSVKNGKAKLILLATDAAENSAKKWQDMCAHRKIPLYRYATKEALGRALGTEERSAVSVEDAGFAQQIEQKLNLAGIGRSQLLDGGNGEC